MNLHRAPTVAMLMVGLGLVLTNRLAAQGAGWGTVKGQVVFGDKNVPAPKKIDVGDNKDKQHCLSQGPLLSDEWTVNPANKGVRWVIVWLAPREPGAPMPVHPNLQKIEPKAVEIDQPCCKFIPHALGIRQGQDLVAKNSAPVAHNIYWAGIKNPGGNVLIPGGGSHTITGLVADRTPVRLNCNIHPWMVAWLRVFDHPYFAVTDDNGKFEIKLAPAGNYSLVTWHEAVGYGPGGRQGLAATIKPGIDTDVGKLELKPAEN
jgi:hypothetical protein